VTWYIAHTLSGIEFKMSDLISEVGIEVYIPVYQRRVKPRHVSGFRIVTLPLLARYLMIRSDNIGPDRRKIHERTGRVWFYEHRTSTREEPHYVSMREEDVAGLKAKEAAGMWNNLQVDDPNEIAVGSVVWIVTLDRRGTVTAKLKGNKFKVEVERMNVVAAGHHLRKANGEGVG
jgi:hypothetical protein